MAEERWTWPVAVPTTMWGAHGSLLLTGASGAKYITVAPESTMPVLSGVSCVCGVSDGLQVGGLQGNAVCRELLAKLSLELTNTAVTVPPVTYRNTS